ncbi:NYN domain-containing protein [Oerskovia flava]|uniref:NYN domain-containing protein n=1 Tax=Oerskovia flava TaxID=2986422 RepID=UPI0022403761|nr:NYN domain-containing protein [Oerskovia sp. JB1-3-2]
MGKGASHDKKGGTPASPDVPPPVRAALVESAARVLGELDPLLVPVTLQRVRTFAPRRRASSGAAPLWHALVGDDGFRHAVASRWTTEHPQLARRLTDPADGPEDAPDDGGGPRPEPGTLDLAVGAFLLRPDGWQAHLERAGAAHDERSNAEVDHAAADRLRREHDRATSELVELRARVVTGAAELEDAREQLAVLRRQERRLRSDADRARAEARRERDAARADLEAARAAREEAGALRRAAAADRERAESERATARSTAQVGADLANARAKLLLDAVVDAAVGLRRELGLPPAAVRPAEVVEAGTASVTPRPVSRPGSRGRSGDDPALLDDLLSVPHTHLVVDGYNVTKTGFDDLALVDQRRRLVDGLVRVASRTGAEISCCFDGQRTGAGTSGTSGSGGATTARGVRVLFSSGEIADDLIRRLVAAEPVGRPVVVVTSDRAVADDVQAMGAVAVGAPALLARLGRL